MTEPSRLDAIEIKLAHLERSLQELGQTVMRQQRDIDVLSAHNRALTEQLKIFEGGGASAQGFETPPHY
jgi:SlyX protein